MASDLKADLERLVELRARVSIDQILSRLDKPTAEYIEAAANLDHAAVLARLESLEAENQRLREENAFLMDSLQQR